MLTLTLFGTGQARFLDRPIDGFPCQRPCLLLSYLAVHRHRQHQRENLAAALWPDTSTRSSRKRLRNSLWRLRKTFRSVNAELDDFITVGENTLAFQPRQSYWLDIEAFEDLVMACRDVTELELTATRAAQLQEAVNLYCGDLLEDVYAEWCLVDRERLRLRFLESMSKLMLYHETQGTYDQGIALGRRILALDHYQERIHRRLMRLHWYAGDPCAALVQYRLCAQLLRDELGVDPSQKTRQVYHQMVSGEFPGAIEQRYSSPTVECTHSNQGLERSAGYLLQSLSEVRASLDETSQGLRRIELYVRSQLMDTSVRPGPVSD